MKHHISIECIEHLAVSEYLHTFLVVSDNSMMAWTDNQTLYQRSLLGDIHLNALKYYIRFFFKADTASLI